MAGAAFERALSQTDLSDLSEGLYIKAETASQTVARYKFIRHGFLRAILESGSHWRARTMITNGLDLTSIHLP